MANADKVIAECKWAIDKITVQGFTTMTSKGFFKDVMSLLKEQDPVPPMIQGNKIYCGVCMKRISQKVKSNYCHKCGRQIKW